MISRDLQSALDPIGDKDIRIAGLGCMPVGFPDQLLAIGAEHGEPVEVLVEGKLLQTCAIAVDKEEIEIPATWILHVRGEDDLAGIGMEIGREIGRSV